MLRANSALPSSSTDTVLVAPKAPTSARSLAWASQAAQELEHNFICNVTKLPTEPADHPGISHLADLLLPKNTHLVLFGTSHVRSVRSVLVSVAKYFGRDVTSSMLSQSDDCDGNSSAPSHLLRL